MCHSHCFLALLLQAASLQKQLDLAEAEAARLNDAAATAASRLSNCQAELAAARQDAAGGRHAADAARHEVAQVCEVTTGAAVLRVLGFKRETRM